MNMTFEPWPDVPAGQAVDFVALLRGAAKGFSDRPPSPGRSKPANLHFYVIDVTSPGGDPDRLARKLSQLLLSDKIATARANRIERFLFVGETSSLEMWEQETSRRRSVKKSVEFYVRTLCGAGLAHYGSVADKTSRKDARRQARSAVLALTRYYGDHRNPLPFAQGRAALRKRITDLFEHVRRHEAYLVPLSVDDGTLLEHVAILFQLGKRDTDIVYPMVDSLMRCEDLWRSRTRPSAYALRKEMQLFLSRKGKGQWQGAPSAEDLLLDLWRYELLRDLGRYIATNAVRPSPTPREALRPSSQGGGGVLIVDDGLYRSSDRRHRDSEDAFADKLKALLRLTGWDKDCLVAQSRPPPTAAPGSNDGVPVSARPLAGGKLRPVDARNFDLILLEVDSTHQYVGPEAVRRLWRDLTSASQGGYVPPIIVLTRTESFEHIQQSLNLGAKAYVLKERIYQLPFQMRRALDSVAGYRDETPISSAFRKLRILRPEDRAKLHRTGPTHFIHGGLETEEGIVRVDAREEAWIEALPKAELHCHMGGCVGYRTIHLLARNTVGHLLGSASFDDLSIEIREVVALTALIVKLAERLHAECDNRLPALVSLAWAASICVEKTENLKPLPPLGVGDQLVAWIHRGSGRIHDFEVMALLVGCLSAGAADPQTDLRPEAYLGAIDALARTGAAIGPLARASREAAESLRRTARSWSGANAKPAVGVVARAGDDKRMWHLLADEFERRVSLADKVLKHQSGAAQTRLAGTNPALRDPLKLSWDKIASRLDLARDKLGIADYLRSGPTLPVMAGKLPQTVCASTAARLRRLTLEECVTVPMAVKVGEYRQRGLQRYLWGSDLLGSEHFQYPENLLLAAYALTLDNARDNVPYCEVRCETTGYCRAGMNAVDATELLCRAFDLAAQYLHGNGLRLVRTNVILAAKRHKKKEAARRVVSVLETFLERRAAVQHARSGDEGICGWWQPTRVVGFDLCGDEATEAPWLAEVMEPLARLSSPVTIHAGEAATAESIWGAVYRLNATRIGHGLRLRENSALLQYCVDEGICMEMCPNSNAFTNAYQANRWGIFPVSHDNPRSTYPLFDFMKAGLEVAVGTDNRYLHPEGRRTLTSEYLTACRLSGGLTRWEVLQLLKSGFKNAFLPKAEVRELLGEMEERVYAGISKGWS